MTQDQINAAAAEYSFEQHNPPKRYVTDSLDKVITDAFKAGVEFAIKPRLTGVYEQLVGYFEPYGMADSSVGLYGQLTTKEAAEHLGVSVGGAYNIMKALEAQQLVCNFGIRVKGGVYEDSTAVGAARAKSITWQVFDKAPEL